MIPDYDALARLAELNGFTGWAPLDVSAIRLKPAVRRMCADDLCGQYGRCWSCPPGCGTLEACDARIRQYARGILVQSCGDLRDCDALEAAHLERFSAMYAALRDAGARVLALGAGYCRICPECTYPHHPCRYPDRMVCSMEACGMLVAEVCAASGLRYFYGPDKLAFTSCFLT